MKNRVQSEIVTIIVTFNGRQFIKNCLNSVKASTILTDIIVIDNASEDDTRDIIKREFPEVTLFESKVNRGFGYANNVGIASALKIGNYKYFFLLNQDTIVGEECIAELKESLEKNRDFGIISPKHLAESGELESRFQCYIENNQDYLCDLSRGQLRGLYAVRFINAAAWLMSDTCIDTVGGFNTILYSHYGEDEDYCNRLAFHHLKIGFVPKAELVHFRSNKMTPDSIMAYKWILLRQRVELSDVSRSEKEIRHLYKKYILSISLVFLKSLAILNFPKINLLYKEWKNGNIFIKSKLKLSRNICRKKYRNFLDLPLIE